MRFNCLIFLTPNIRCFVASHPPTWPTYPPDLPTHTHLTYPSTHVTHLNRKQIDSTTNYYYHLAYNRFVLQYLWFSTNKKLFSFYIFEKKDHLAGIDCAMWVGRCKLVVNKSWAAASRLSIEFIAHSIRNPTPYNTTSQDSLSFSFSAYFPRGLVFSLYFPDLQKSSTRFTKLHWIIEECKTRNIIK